MKKLCFCLLMLYLLSPLAALAVKTDVVVLTNGDRVTGEVKSLEAGLLEFSTDTMGIVKIEWRFIADLYSSKTQTVETTNGNRWVGRLSKPEGSDSLILTTSEGAIQLNLAEVVSAWPVEATFWDKSELSVSAGFDYAKSTEITNLNLAADYRYRTDTRLTDASWRTYVTRQTDGDDQTRNEARASHQYFLPRQRFRSYLGGLETNEALGLNLRSYIGLGIGKYLVKTNNTWFSLGGGVIATNENPVDGSSEQNLEALGNLRYRYFRYAHPKRSFDTSLTVFPSLTDFGRVRSDLRSTFRLELIADLYWALELYANYDSEPLAEDVEKADYGITTSLGYKF